MNNKVNPANIVSRKNKGMDVNNCGKPTFTIDMWNRLDRYVIIGSETGTYYATAEKITTENLDNVLDCIKQDGIRVLNRVIEISDQALAPKNDQAIFVLALCLTKGDLETRRYAKENVSKIVRTGSHLTQFVDFLKTMRGKGRLFRNSISKWYLDLPIESLVFQTTKYPMRNGISHRDLLRMSHAKPVEEIQATVFKWITDPDSIPSLPNNEAEREMKNLSESLYKYALSKQLVNYSVDEVARLVVEYNLPHEVIPTEMKNDTKIWQALLDSGMPLNATIRNLNKMTLLGMLDPLSENAKNLCEKFRNQAHIQKSRLHPINILTQMRAYNYGRSMDSGNYRKNTLVWNPNPHVVNALEDAFYLSFKNIEPTNKPTLIALDVSGSMGCQANGSILSCCEVTAAMAMATARVETNYHIMAFCHDFVELPITGRTSLNEALKIVTERNFGYTDCSLPFKYALKKKMNVDNFLVYTDNETNCNNELPSLTLKKYREASGSNAKLVVVACTASRFTIADPNDPGMLDIAGFSSAVPQIIGYFCK